MMHKPLVWFQQLCLGMLRTPQAVYRAAQAENPDPAIGSDRFLSVPPDDPSWTVPVRLKAPSWFLSDACLKQWDRADWRGVDPRLIKWAATFQELARLRSIPLYVHCALRGRAEQDEALRLGRSKTPFPKSKHNVGRAVDIVHGVFHWDLSPSEWRFIHHIGLRSLDLVNAGVPKAQQLVLDWGGNWAFYDPSHWEVSGPSFGTPLPYGSPIRFTPRGILRNMR